MFKNISWKTLLLTSFLTLFGWWTFWEIKETITGERMFFVVRWLFYSPSSEKKIEIHPYLLSDEQVLNMLLHPNEDIQQPNEHDLYSKELNVVLRIRNNKAGLAWGKLSWRTGKGGWSKVDVEDIIPKNTKRYIDFIFPVGIIVHSKNDTPPEPIEVKWDALYIY